MEEKLDLDTIGALINTYVKVKEQPNKIFILADLRVADSFKCFTDSEWTVATDRLIGITGDGQIVYTSLNDVEPLPTTETKPERKIEKKALCLLQMREGKYRISAGVRTLEEHKRHYFFTNDRVVRFPVGEVFTFIDGVLQE